MRTIVWLSVAMTILGVTGCLSPHGGFQLPFTGEPKPPEPKPQVDGGDGRTHKTAFRVRRINEGDLDYLEDSALYGHLYFRLLHGKQQHVPMESRPTEAEFRRGISRAKQRVGKRIYHEVTFRAATGEEERRYFDITDLVCD